MLNVKLYNNVKTTTCVFSGKPCKNCSDFKFYLQELALFLTLIFVFDQSFLFSVKHIFEFGVFTMLVDNIYCIHNS